MILQYPDPILGSIEIDIGEIEEQEIDPRHLKEAEKR